MTTPPAVTAPTALAHAARRWWTVRFGGLPPAFWRWMAVIGGGRIGFTVVPFLAFWLGSERHLTATGVAWVMAAFGAGWTAAAPLGGWLADRIGRRTVLVCSSIAAAGAYLLLGSVGVLFPGTGGYTATIATAAVTGLCFDLYRPGVQAAITDTIGSSDRGRAMAGLYLMLNTSRLVSSILSGLMASGDFRWLFIGNAATSLATAYAAGRFLPASPRRRPRLQPRAQPRPAGRTLLVFTLVTFVFYTVHTQSMVALPLVLAGHGATPLTYGLLLALDPLVVIVVQLTAQRPIVRAPALIACAVGVVLVGGGLAATGLSSTLTAAAATTPLWVTGEVIFLIAAPTVVAQLAPEHLRGRYFGTWGATQGAAAICAPLLAAATGGTAAVWIGGALASLAAAAGCIALHTTIQPHGLPSKGLLK